MRALRLALVRTFAFSSATSSSRRARSFVYIEMADDLVVRGLVGGRLGRALAGRVELPGEDALHLVGIENGSEASNT